MSIKMRKMAAMAAIFLLVLAFLSKSIVYWTTPKVTVSSVISGTITYRNQINASRILSDGMQKVQTPATLPEGLVVTWLIEGKQKSVVQGEALIYVDEASLKKQLLSAEKKYFEALVSLSAYKKNDPTARENAAIKALERAEAALQKEPNATGKRAEKLKAAYDTAYDTYYQVVTLGIYEMTSLSNMTEQCDLAKAELDKLQTIYNNQCAILSPCDGTLVSWPNKDTLLQLPANKTLFEILPNDVPCEYVGGIGHPAAARLDSFGGRIGH